MTIEAAPEEAPVEQLTDDERARLKRIVESPQFLATMKDSVREKLDQEEDLEESDLQWLREFIIIWRGI